MQNVLKLARVLFVTDLMVDVIAACGNNNDGNNNAGNKNAPNNDQNAGEQKEELSGTVVIDGSGTVYPLMAHIAEEYMTNEQTKVSVQVGRAGSSAGFKKFIP